MNAITGITGKVGGALARTLLASSQPVRSVVRDTTRGQPWGECGWEETRWIQRRLDRLRRRESNCAQRSGESGNVTLSVSVGSWLICIDPPTRIGGLSRPELPMSCSSLRSPIPELPDLKVNQVVTNTSSNLHRLRGDPVDEPLASLKTDMQTAKRLLGMRVTGVELPA
jgi:hypothetical protein